MYCTIYYLRRFLVYLNIFPITVSRFRLLPTFVLIARLSHLAILDTYPAFLLNFLLYNGDFHRHHVRVRELLPPETRGGERAAGGTERKAEEGHRCP